MQVVINIPKKTFDEIRDRNITHCGEPFAQKLVSYIRNGTPLPKEHGRLIDVDDLREDFQASKGMSFSERMTISCIISNAPTIIEAR